MEYTDEQIEEIDRCARAYGWEIGRGQPFALKIETVEENPFANPNWRENVPGYKDEQQAAKEAYPDHAPATALANYRAGRQVWDTNGDLL